MATKVRPRAKDLYDEDFYVWTEVQTGLLRERNFDALPTWSRRSRAWAMPRRARC
jgi:hypothetical protein